MRALLLLLLAAPLHAEGTTQIGQAGTDPIGISLFPVAGMHDMEGKRWTFAVAPGIWSIKDISGPTRGHSISGPCGPGFPGNTCGSGKETFDAVLKGWVLGAALKRELNPHWGVGVVLGLARQTNTGEVGPFLSGLAPTGAPGISTGTKGGEFSDVSGDAIALLFTYDHWTDPDHFRMPVSIGPFFARQSFKYSHQVSATQKDSVDFKRSFLGVMVNVSFDFVVFKKFKVMPGILYGAGFAGSNPGYTYVTDVSGAKTKYKGALNDARPEIGTLYLEILYRPWNLSISKPFVPQGSYLDGTTVKWTRRWGA